jgi:hypothetical protein
MFAVSEVLQRARLDQGIDLATVAARTRIKTKYLQAIEANDPKSLPGGFFYKSFAHQYATFLGVDTKAIDAEIDRVLGVDAAPPLAPLPRAAEQSAEKLTSRFRPHTGGLLWSRRLVAREPRGGHREKCEPRSGFRFAGCIQACGACAECCCGSGRFQSRACFDGYGRDLAFGFFGWHANLLRPSRGQSDKDHRRQRFREVTGWQRGWPGSAIERQAARPTGRTRSSSGSGVHTG